MRSILSDLIVHPAFRVSMLEMRNLRLLISLSITIVQCWPSSSYWVSSQRPVDEGFSAVTGTVVQNSRRRACRGYKRQQFCQHVLGFVVTGQIPNRDIARQRPNDLPGRTRYAGNLFRELHSRSAASFDAAGYLLMRHPETMQVVVCLQNGGIRSFTHSFAPGLVTEFNFRTVRLLDFVSCQ
jgi:hypothetical protein